MANNLKVNCLVQVTSNSETDFVEWLEYHIALGFDYIFVFDTAIHSWLDKVCGKYKNVVMVPRDDWRRKSVIIQTYVSRRKAPEWAICLDDHEFLWLDLGVAKNIREFVARIPGSVGALTAYVKYMSSEVGMKNRVGTQIDCFTHVRQDPQVSTDVTPNTAVTMFMVTNPSVMPLKNAVVPVCRGWCDGRLRPINEEMVSRYMTSREYNPSAFPLRVYKFALRSGIEMEFKPGTRPLGYTIVDPAMQKERAALLNIPVNLETEKLFAKDDVLVTESANEPAELSAEEQAELDLPVNVGRIDQMILNGRYYEDVEQYVAQVAAERNVTFDAAALERVFNREREMIALTPAYRDLHKMLTEGMSESEIMEKLRINQNTYHRMCECVKVLAIEDEPAVVDQVEMAAAPITEEVSSSTEPETITELVEQFDADVEANDLSPETKAEQEAVFEEIEKNRKAKAKARRAKKASNKPKTTKKGKKKSALAGSEEEKAELSALVKECTSEPEPEIELEQIEGLDDDNLLNDLDLSAMVSSSDE